MRIIPVISMVSALALAGCALPPIVEEPVEQPFGTGATTAFTWKGNTPRAVRAADINECELGGRGLAPGATNEQIRRASAVADPAQVSAFVNRCLSNKGYVLTEIAVCAEQDIGRGQFVQGADILPPLDRIRCVDPVRRGIVVA